jgi:PAS domain S-box-containing protein
MTNYGLTKDDGFLSSIYERFQTNFFIIKVDEAGDFAYGGINPAYEKTIGLSNEEIVGKRPEEVRGMSPEQAAAVRANCRRCLAAGEMIT